MQHSHAWTALQILHSFTKHYKQTDTTHCTNKHFKRTLLSPKITRCLSHNNTNVLKADCTALQSGPYKCYCTVNCKGLSLYYSHSSTGNSKNQSHQLTHFSAYSYSTQCNYVFTHTHADNKHLMALYLLTIFLRRCQTSKCEQMQLVIWGGREERIKRDKCEWTNCWVVYAKPKHVNSFINETCIALQRCCIATIVLPPLGYNQRSRLLTFHDLYTHHDRSQ